MTKLDLSRWDETKTLKENQAILGVTYSYAAQQARIHQLKYVPDRLGPAPKNPVSFTMNNTNTSESPREVCNDWKPDEPVERDRYKTYLGMGEGAD